MALTYNTSIVRPGLLVQLDPANLAKHGNSPYKNLAGPGTITNTSFDTVSGIFRSDCVNSATGNSELDITGITSTTGSVTVQFFIKVTSDPNVDSNNNWRRLIANNAGVRSPFGFVLEQSRYINFTLHVEGQFKRHVDGGFTAVGPLDIGQWYMVTYTYDSTTGIATTYEGTQKIRQGSQTNSGGADPTGPGDKMVDIGPGGILTISNNNTNSGGDACLPADLGSWLIYDRALSPEEVERNFESLRGRYGI